MKKIFTLFAALAMVMSMFAADIPAGTKFYLTPNANWNQSNARFAVYFYGNGDEWVSMTKVDGETNLYEVTSPSKVYKNLIFCRMNPSATANNWNNKWNQTGDLTYDGTKNHCTIKEGQWDCGQNLTWSIWPIPAVKTYKDINITITANAEPQIKWSGAGDKLADGGYVAMTATGAEKTYSYTLAQVDEATGVEYTIKVGEIEGAAQQTSVDVTADFKQLLPQVAVMGVNNWDGTDKMTVADDYLSASITLALAENKAYALKLTVDANWVGGSNVNITKDNNSALFAEDTGGDGKITTDLAGDYVFTYTYATKTLVVTYPVVEPVEPEEPTYEIYEQAITNLVIDFDNMLLIGGPSEEFLVTVTLGLGEYDMTEGIFQLLPESEISVQGYDATFVEGWAYVDGIANTAEAVVRCLWNDMAIEFHLSMSAAPLEATVVVVENAAVEIEKVLLFGDMYDYALKMTGIWTNEGVDYPVLVEVPVYYPEATEPSEINSTVTVGGWEDDDPWLGFGEGILTITTIDGVVTATGVVTNQGVGIAIDITISGTLPQGPTGVENNTINVKAMKVIRDGQLIIRNNGVEFNAQGAIVK